MADDIDSGSHVRREGPQARYPWRHHGETLVIETPEQTRVEYRVASFGARLTAALIDNAVVLGLGLALALVTLLWGGATDMMGGYLVVAVLVLWFLTSLFYFTIAELRGDGQTPGKRMAGLRTVMATGHGLTFGAALTRNLARLVDNLPVLWFVPALTKGKRRIGDLLAGTYVIEEQKRAIADGKGWLDQLAPSWRELTDRRFGSLVSVHDKLSVDDLDLLEYLGDRLRAVPNREQRRHLLAEIARKYVTRLDLAADAEAIDADPARFLQELGLFLRDQLQGGSR